MKKTTLLSINSALALARAKNPQRRGAFVSLVKWTGGLAWALTKGEPDQIRMRAAIVAALAIRIFEEGDSSFDEGRRDANLPSYSPPYPGDGE